MGAFSPLPIAVAVVLLAAGGAFGWTIRSSAPTAHAAAGVTRAALALETLSSEKVCGAGGDDLLREVALRADGPVAEDVVDYLPKKSPIPGYERAGTRPLDPTGDTEYLSGAVEGQVSSFRPSGEGWFDVYAYRYLTRPAALESVAATIAGRACGGGAKVFAARGRPGMLVLDEGAGGGWLSAWWLTRADVVVVRYAGWGDPDADLANLAVILGAAAAPD